MSTIFNKQFLYGFVAGGSSAYLYNQRQQSLAKKVNVWDEPYRADHPEGVRRTIGHKVDAVKDNVQDNSKQVYNAAKQKAEDVQDTSENVVGNVVHALKHTADYTKEQLFENDKNAEAEKRAQNLSLWGSKKVDEAKDKYNQTAADAENTKNSWINWGNKKADDAKSDYDKAVQDLKNQRDEMHANAAKKKDEWSSWKSKKVDDAKDTIDDNAHQIKQGAKNTKDSITNRVPEKVDNSYRGEAARELHQAKNSWLSWGSKKAADVSETLDNMKDDKTEVELARVNRDALSGWGENAAQLAKEEYEIANNK